MNKTVHKKLTASQSSKTQILHYSTGSVPASFSHELKLLQKAAKELLQPRPEAITNLMKMARTL